MLALKDVSKTYQAGSGQTTTAVEGLNFTVSSGEFVCLLGRSGCGKTTTLRMIAGLEKASAGGIYMDRRKITGPGPERCVVFQQYTLFPWRRVLKNIAFGLEMQGIKKKERCRIAREYLELVGLGPYANAFPYELSGGMQQRVAVARALAADPRLLLMDEPFGALDAQTRRSLQNELIQIWQKRRKTIVFVTHSINEAIYLSDRIIVMKSRPGRIREIIKNPLPRPRDNTRRDTTELHTYICEQLEAVSTHHA
jgi:NitT/TauT family transport system ATP-binding protein